MLVHHLSCCVDAIVLHSAQIEALRDFQEVNQLIEVDFDASRVDELDDVADIAIAHLVENNRVDIATVRGLSEKFLRRKNFKIFLFCNLNLNKINVFDNTNQKVRTCSSKNHFVSLHNLSASRQNAIRELIISQLFKKLIRLRFFMIFPVNDKTHVGNGLGQLENSYVVVGITKDDEDDGG